MIRLSEMVTLDGGMSILMLHTIFLIPLIVAGMFYPMAALAGMVGLAVLSVVGLGALFFVRRRGWF